MKIDRKHYIAIAPLLLFAGAVLLGTYILLDGYNKQPFHNIKKGGES